MRISTERIAVSAAIAATMFLSASPVSTAENTGRAPVQYRLRQIMMEPTVSPGRVAAVRDGAEAILNRARAGEDFTTLAKRYSEEPGAKTTGGDLGFFTFDQMVKPFSEAVFSMKPGELRGPVRTQYGWHIINLLEIKGNSRHARHILLMLTPGRQDSLKVLETLEGVRRKLIGGEKFDALLHQYNTVDTLIDTDGYMVWQTPDEMLPEFAHAVKGLKTGDVSCPFVSIIGFHIVVVDSINHNPGRLLSGFPPAIERKLKNKAQSK